MRTIWKFPLRLVSGEQLVRTMPANSVAVHFDMQGDTPTVWCNVDPDASQIDRKFVIVGTGHEIPEGSIHIGSVQARGFVWHLFELL